MAGGRPAARAFREALDVVAPSRMGCLREAPAGGSMDAG